MLIILDRYSEFEDLRRKLSATYPSSEGAMPSLPPKSVVREQYPYFLFSAVYAILTKLRELSSQLLGKEKGRS